MFVGGMCVGMECGSGCACLYEQAGLLLHVDEETTPRWGRSAPLGFPVDPLVQMASVVRACECLSVSECECECE